MTSLHCPHFAFFSSLLFPLRSLSQDPSTAHAYKHRHTKYRTPLHFSLSLIYFPPHFVFLFYPLSTLPIPISSQLSLFSLSSPIFQSNATHSQPTLLISLTPFFFPQNYAFAPHTPHPTSFFSSLLFLLPLHLSHLTLFLIFPLRTPFSLHSQLLTLYNTPLLTTHSFNSTISVMSIEILGKPHLKDISP